MTGWRIGFILAPEYIAKHILKIHQYNVTCASTISQYAALEAVTKGFDDAVPMRNEFEKRRDYIYNELKNDAGTGIAVNPKTGEVLAMVSAPSYDPNLCVLGYPASKWQALSNDPNKPFVNRFAGAYPPGSTFKPLTASLGITKGTLIPENVVAIEGEKWQPSPSWGKDFITRVDVNVTKLNLNTALIFSDNIYFAQVALNVGIQDFIDGAKKFGISEDIPFPYPLKSSQIGNNNKITSARQLADTAYGQAQVLINPLQLGLIYSTFLNEGNIPVPLLEKGSKEEIWKQNVISPEVANRVLQGLVEVVNNPSGPCYKDARIPGVTIAGKTGTAELNSSSNGKDEKQLGWFVGFNTANPQLLVVMMAENVQGRGESHYVVPKVKNVIQRYLKAAQGQ
jgi:penicillin-binding protein